MRGAFSFYTMYTMKNNNQNFFSFSFKDWKAEMKSFSNPFDWKERVWLAFAYTSKSGFEKTATFNWVDVNPERLAVIFDLLSVSTSCREVVTILSGYDFMSEDKDWTLIQRVQEPRYSWIRQVR